MAAWFGGLVVLVLRVTRAPSSGRVELETALARFSRLALMCWAGIAATGIYLAWRQVGTPGALPNTDYGRWLLVKLALVAMVIGLANFARRYVARYRRDESAPLSRLRVSVGSEAFLGVAVIAVTAMLVNSAPARTAYTPVVDKVLVLPDEAQQLLSLKNAAVRLKVTPARTGANVFDIYLKASADERKLFRAAEVTGRLDAANTKVQSLPVTIRQAEPGHYVATAVSIPFPGRWLLRLDLRISEFDEIPISIPFKVR
jgi:copper transport protein